MYYNLRRINLRTRVVCILQGVVNHWTKSSKTSLINSKKVITREGISEGQLEIELLPERTDVYVDDGVRQIWDNFFV